MNIIVFFFSNNEANSSLGIDDYEKNTLKNSEIERKKEEEWEIPGFLE